MRNLGDLGVARWPVAALLAAGLAVAGAAWAGEAGQGGGSGPAKSAATPDITFVDDDDAAPAGKAAARNPFSSGEAPAGRKDAVPGYLEVSTGLKIPGYIYTTRAKRLKVYNLQRQVYEYIPVPALEKIETAVEWEREDKEWRFKEAGNPEKVYSGRTYPVRMHKWRLTLRNGHVIDCHILGTPLYVMHGGKEERFIIHKRDKGPIGVALKDLVYIKAVAFGPEAYNLAVDELRAKAEAAK